MKRFLLSILAAIAVLVPMLAITPTASAATGVVTNGTGWTADPAAPPTLGERACTLGVVGTDSSGNKIAISAAHCVNNLANAGTNNFPDGSTVFQYITGVGTGNAIGTVMYRDAVVDYVVIELYPDAVLLSNGPGTRIDGIGAANPGGIHCKDGIGSGVRCGTITNNVPWHRFYSTALIGGSDSGGPAYQGTQLIGLNRGFDIAQGGFEFIKFSAVQSSIAAQGNPAGKGFVVTNN